MLAISVLAYSMLRWVRRFPRIATLHLVRSCVSFAFKPKPFKSLTRTCFHVFLGLPIDLATSTTEPLQPEIQSSAFLRSTCPNHLNLPLLITSNTLSTPNRLRISSIFTLLFNCTPHIHLILQFCVLSNLFISSSFVAHVSLPYTKTDCTHALYTFPFMLKDASLVISKVINSTFSDILL